MTKKQKPLIFKTFLICCFFIFVSAKLVTAIMHVVMGQNCALKHRSTDEMLFLISQGHSQAYKFFKFSFYRDEATVITCINAVYCIGVQLCSTFAGYV